jgi:hypothetical protein
MMPSRSSISRRKFQRAWRCRVKAHCHSFAIPYIDSVNRLTNQEQRVLCVVLGLLLLGLAVKTYRARHPLVAITANGVAGTPAKP